MTIDSRTHLPDGTKTKSYYVSAASADLRTETGIGTQALFGQRFLQIETKNDQAYGALLSIVTKASRIDYIGFLPAEALSEGKFQPSHIVIAVTATIFEEADIKSPLRGSLARNSALEGSVEGDFLKLRNGGFVHLKHLQNYEGEIERAFPSAALDMLNLPYVWGGTGHVGVDCSGLVQSALAATGVDAPRDADQQEMTLGETAPFGSRRSGDLLFWPGHVGIVLEDDQLLHANAHHMCVAVEPVVKAVKRIGGVRTTKRL